MDDVNLTKQEFQYLKNIEKLETLVEKLETKVKEQEKTEAKLRLENESLTADLGTAKQANETHVKTETQLNEQITTLQAENKDLTNSHNELEKSLSELRSQQLPDQELLFYYACKADTILETLLSQQKQVVSADELRSHGFPDALLAKVSTEPLETTNFILNFHNDTYQIKRNQ